MIPTDCTTDIRSRRKLLSMFETRGVVVYEKTVGVFGTNVSTLAFSRFSQNKELLFVGATNDLYVTDVLPLLNTNTCHSGSRKVPVGDSINDIAHITPNTLGLGCDSGKVMLLDLETSKVINSAQVHFQVCNSIAVQETSPKQTAPSPLLDIPSFSQSYRRIRSTIRRINTQSSPVLPSNNNQTSLIASVGQDGRIILNDIRMNVLEPAAVIESAHKPNNDSSLKKSIYPRYVTSWDVAKKIDAATVTCVRFLNRWQFVTSGSLDCSVKMWDIRNFNKSAWIGTQPTFPKINRNIIPHNKSGTPSKRKREVLFYNVGKEEKRQGHFPVSWLDTYDNRFIAALTLGDDTQLFMREPDTEYGDFKHVLSIEARNREYRSKVAFGPNGSFLLMGADNPFDLYDTPGPVIVSLPQKNINLLSLSDSADKSQNILGAYRTQLKAQFPVHIPSCLNVSTSKLLMGGTAYNGVFAAECGGTVSLFVRRHITETPPWRKVDASEAAAYISGEAPMYREEYMNMFTKWTHTYNTYLDEDSYNVVHNCSIGSKLEEEMDGWCYSGITPPLSLVYEKKLNMTKYQQKLANLHYTSTPPSTGTTFIQNADMFVFEHNTATQDLNIESSDNDTGNMLFLQSCNLRHSNLSTPINNVANPQEAKESTWMENEIRLLISQPKTDNGNSIPLINDSDLIEEDKYEKPLISFAEPVTLQKEVDTCNLHPNKNILGVEQMSENTQFHTHASFNSETTSRSTSTHQTDHPQKKAPQLDDTAIEYYQRRENNQFSTQERAPMQIITPDVDKENQSRNTPALHLGESDTLALKEMLTESLSPLLASYRDIQEKLMAIDKRINTIEKQNVSIESRLNSLMASQNNVQVYNGLHISNRSAFESVPKGAHEDSNDILNEELR